MKVRSDVKGGQYIPDMSGVCDTPTPYPPYPTPYPPAPTPSPVNPYGVIDRSGYCG